MRTCGHCGQPLMKEGECIYSKCPLKLEAQLREVREGKKDYEYLVKEGAKFIPDLEIQLNAGLFDWEFVQIFKFHDRGCLCILYRRPKR